MWVVAIKFGAIHSKYFFFKNWYNDIYVVVINYLLSGYLAIIGYYLTNLIVFVKKKKKKKILLQYIANNW